MVVVCRCGSAMGVNGTKLDQDTTKRTDQRKEKEAMEDVGGFYLGSRLGRVASDNGYPARVTSYRTRTTSPRVDGGMWWVLYSLFADGGGCEIRKPKVHTQGPG